MVYFILGIVAVVGVYFTFRYFSLISALKKMTRDIDQAAKQLDQNQQIHMPIPNQHLGEMVQSFNQLLKNVQEERQNYVQREEGFKKQIENISHDLRTPLTVILGYLKIMKNDMTIAEETKESLLIVEKKAEVMKNLVNQFYEFSRLESNSVEVKLDKVDIGKLARESLLGNYQLLETAQLEINADIPNTPLYAIADSELIERIFLNLFQNARRYARSFFHITVKEEKGFILVLFTNDTVDITKADIANLFNRFYMHNQARNTEKTGLGLTIAKGLAEASEGTLSASIVEQKGNVKQIQFELRLKSL